MAGTLIVSNLTTDTDNTFIVRSNTGTTLFSANTTGIDVANSIGATAITNDKILSVANTKISGNIISSQITSIGGSQITANTIANSAIQTGAVENYMSAAGLGFGMRNRIINGDMRIDQRNAGASYTQVNGVFNLDRWDGNTYDGGAAVNKYSVIQSSTAPTGFSNSLLVTSLAATADGASNIFNIEQRIEGFNFADFMYGTANARTLTLSFWVRSSLTGTFGGALKNSARNRAYPFTYTISTANTFEYKTVTIAGDTSGTWIGATNGVGLWLSFGLGVGSTYSGTAGAWGAGDLFSATGATSVVGTNGATFYITGVQLEKGSTATSFDYRQYGTELQLCQRYYTKSFAPGTVPANGSNGTTITTTIGAYAFTISRPNGGPTVTDSTNLSTSGSPIVFPVQMRASPSITQYGNSSGQWWYRDVSGANTGWAAFSGSVFYTADRFLPNFSSIINVDSWAHAVGHWVASSEL